jgi:hypothetical protein
MVEALVNHDLIHEAPAIGHGAHLGPKQIASCLGARRARRQSR